ncbi:MAG: hypothetical protein K0R57_5752 [Paenibacillaceae bacterium]|nr:hypothetical protein [Paenibacillaceae bacterium]
MQKQCKCGCSMDICLRTVIYQNKVEIEYVPVFTCDSCNRSEVFPGIKQDLTKLIGTLGAKPEKQRIRFDESCELAHLMKAVTDKENRHEPVGKILEERINELLDMLLLSRSLDDQPWMEEIMVRLSQITRYTVSAYELKS